MKSINTFFIHSDYHLLDIDLVRDLPPSLRSNFSSQIWMGDFRNASPRSASCTALDDTFQLNSVSLSLKGTETWRDEKTPATERLHYSHKEENRKIATFDFLETSKIISSFSYDYWFWIAKYSPSLEQICDETFSYINYLDIDYGYPK